MKENKNINQEEIDILKEEIEELERQKDILENNYNTDEYDEFLDECSPEVKIGNLSYSPSQVLKNVDEIAYNCGLSEYNDDKINELEDEIKEKEEEIENLKNEN